MKTVKQIIKIMEQEISILELILNIEKEKYQTLYAGKLVDFSPLNEQVEKFIVESNKLETLRLDIMESLYLERVGKSIFPSIEKGVSLEEIFPFVESEDQEVLKDLIEKMKYVVHSIQSITQVNRELIENALQVLDISLGGKNSQPSTDYTSKEGDYTRESVLINKII